MDKSILLLDTPKNCVKCRFSVAYDYSFCSEQTRYICSITGKDTGCRTDGWLDDKIFKADWCPLKARPRMKFTYIDHDDDATANYNRGWNDCIDKILNK